MTAANHLSLRELLLRPSSEWRPRHAGWVLARVAAGTGYWLRPPPPREVGPGDVMVAAPGECGLLKVSRLHPLRLHVFTIEPRWLHGLMSLAEQQRLETETRKPERFPKILPATDPVARAFAALVERSSADALPARLRLLAVWADAVAGLLAAPEAPGAGLAGLRQRFRQLVGGMLSVELVGCALRGLAQQLHCSQRHVSRLFHQEFGVTFRQRQTQVRLAHAQRLLAGSHDKITNVAYDCGYRHLGLFNTMFKKHFGMTPSEWRRRHADPKRRDPGRPRRSNLLVRLGSLLVVLGTLRGPIALAQTNPPTSTRSAAVSTNTPLRFAVRHYDVRGNTLLSPRTINRIFAGAIGSAISLDQIRQAALDLQAAYRERGFVTVAVSLPQQQLTNATVVVRVLEAPLAAINVVNNHYFSSHNVRRALPSLHTNLLLNAQILQRELELANANRDRQIYPVLGPGPDPGTSALTLRVKDRLPLHGRLEFNNLATPETPDYRLNLAAEYDNLWDLEHHVGVQYSFSPEELKTPSRYSENFLDQPMIANYSAYYRLPLAGPESLQEQVEAAPLTFGYSEVTHQFRLPAPSTQPTLTFYGSRSTTDTGVQLG
ncbi:MAG: helix-turn-helix domain-containing protein, partial [Verrucomicrobia bacterium]|nr:helix-turn-helix domain-containing protein [Verrucomicrobiota bacterium]